MANNKTTREKGDTFEENALQIISRAMENGQIGFVKEYAKVFRKKKYSTTYGTKIEFDLTIEIWPPGAKNFAMVYIIECKNYDSTIPANVMETFHSQLVQIGKFNIKPIFITSSALQLRPREMAKAYGIMVIEGKTSDDYKITVYKKFKLSLSNLPILKETYNPSIIDEGVVAIEKLIDKELVDILNESSENETFNIEKLSKAQIQDKAEMEFNEIQKFKDARVLNSELLKEYLLAEYNINVEYIEMNDLGSCNLQKGTIKINIQLKGTARELFIMCHEFGHFKLHHRLSLSQSAYYTFFDSEYNFRTDRHDLKNPKNWVEWQANYFASCLAMPLRSFLYFLERKQSEMGKTLGKVYVDDQKQNRVEFYELIKHLAYVFHVTQTSVIYKLNDMSLLIDKSNLRPISKIVSEFMNDLEEAYFA